MSARRLFVAAAVLFAAANVRYVPVNAAGSGTRMLRSPSVSANAIAFAYANNIWTVGRAGGTARRQTTFQGPTSNPKL
jgi:tricorn protease